MISLYPTKIWYMVFCELGATQSPLEKRAINNSVADCQILLKFARLVNMDKAENDQRDGQPQVV